MKESSKFLIVIIIVAIFSIATVTVMGAAVTQIAQSIMPGSPDAQMKTETFNSTTISVPITANFTEESGVYVDSRNQIMIQIGNETIPESQLQTYGETFAKQANGTLINSTELGNNTIAIKGPSNETMVMIAGEKQTVIIMAANQELAFKIAKSVKFNG